MSAWRYVVRLLIWCCILFYNTYNTYNTSGLICPVLLYVTRWMYKDSITNFVNSHSTGPTIRQVLYLKFTITYVTYFVPANLMNKHGSCHTYYYHFTHAETHYTMSSILTRALTKLPFSLNLASLLMTTDRLALDKYPI